MSQYQQELQQAVQFMRQHDDFLVVSHVNPDGDTIGSALAMGLLLQQANKRYTVVNIGPIPARFSFLPQFEQLIDLSAKPLTQTFSAVIAIDAADRSRMGEIDHLFAPDVQILNIDHHPTNDYFGQVNVVRSDAAATAEIMFELAKAGNFSFDQPLATCLYTGLLTDTGGFRYSNTTSQVMNMAAELLRFPLQPGMIAEQCLELVSKEHIKLLQRSLASLALSHQEQVAVLTVSHADLLEAGAEPDDLSGIVNYARNIIGVEVGALLAEVKPGLIKVNLRSRRQVDVAAIAKSFGGGGHARAAGYSFAGAMGDAVGQLTARLEQVLGVDADG